MFRMRQKSAPYVPASMQTDKLLVKTLAFGSAILLLALILPNHVQAGMRNHSSVSGDSPLTIEEAVNTTVYSQGTGRAASKVSNPQMLAQAFRDGLQAYEFGNYRQAERLWRELGEQGYITAQFNLGMMYHHGTGIEKNLLEAIEWYRRAAEQGHTNAQYSMGYSYARGMGVTTDMSTAVNWWSRAAGNGSIEAQYSLGLVYAQGLGIEANSEQAVKWWRQAANRGNAAAQFNLGVMYANGEGVAKDMKEAEDLWKKSAAQGYDHAGLALQTLNITNRLKELPNN